MHTLVARLRFCCHLWVNLSSPGVTWAVVEVRWQQGYSDYNIVWCSRFWHEHNSEFPPEQFHCNSACTVLEIVKLAVHVEHSQHRFQPRLGASDIPAQGHCQRAALTASSCIARQDYNLVQVLSAQHGHPDGQGSDQMQCRRRCATSPDAWCTWVAQARLAELVHVACSQIRG